MFSLKPRQVSLPGPVPTILALGMALCLGIWYWILHYGPTSNCKSQVRG